MANNIYYNSRAKALEAKLLSFETLTSLANCKTVLQVSKILNDNNFLKGFEAKTFSDFLGFVLREQEDFLKFLKKEMLDEDISRFFCLKFDYFNLECLFLEKKLAKPFDLLPEGMILISTLKDAVENKDKQKLLPAEMQQALLFCENLFKTQKETGFLIDTTFKKALYKQMLQASKADRALFDCFNAFLDLKNIELCFCFRNTKLFQEARLLGGTLKDDFFEMLCQKPFDVILQNTKNSSYAVAIKLIVEATEQNKPFLKFEFLLDCFGQAFFDEFKFNSSKNYAYIRYCFLRQNEIANLKTIFEGLEAKRSHKKICEELRGIYAK